MKVIIDTSAWIALQVKGDINNPKAKEQFNKYQKRRVLFYTNDYVLMETYTRLIYDVNLSAGKKFRNFVKTAIKENQLTLLEVDSKIRDITWEILDKYSDQQLSFTDATIIAHFKESNLDEIFSFDKHFKKCNLATKP